MKLRTRLGKMFPGAMKAYFDTGKYIAYKKRLNTPPEKYGELIMKEWMAHGDKPFDLAHPVTYRQKIQWAEMYERTPLKATLTDKVAVRDWVKETIGEQYLIPLLAVFDDPDDLDFAKLPDRFVVKMNNSSGMNIIVGDKTKISEKKVKRQLKKWMKIDYPFYSGFQPHYIGIPPKVMVEQYMADSAGELRDYKFLCFNGKVHYCWVDIGRFRDGHCRNIYDMDWKLQPFRQKLPNSTEEVARPQSFDEMAAIAEKLCQGFGHVRVDLYNLDGTIYFGEMTFSNGGGHDPIYPPEYDKILGDMWKID